MKNKMPACGFSYCRANMNGKCHAINARRDACNFKAMNDAVSDAVKMLAPAESDGSRAAEKARQKLIESMESLRAG